jgi:hypothetical protein
MKKLCKTFLQEMTFLQVILQGVKIFSNSYESKIIKICKKIKICKCGNRKISTNKWIKKHKKLNIDGQKHMKNITTNN